MSSDVQQRGGELTLGLYKHTVLSHLVFCWHRQFCLHIMLMHHLFISKPALDKSLENTARRQSLFQEEGPEEGLSFLNMLFYEIHALTSFPVIEP